jgi:Flp pilus assembly pilin Flp
MRVLMSRLTRDESGMTTAEYAVGTVAACGFAGALIQLLTSDGVIGLLRELITRALSAIF